MSGDLNFIGTQEEWDALVKRNQEAQKKLLTEIMEADAKDGLYKQQTAVEWLVKQLFSTYEKLINEDIIEQAKAMEKEQIMKAVYDAMRTNFDPNMGRAEQYYNETYGK